MRKALVLLVLLAACGGGGDDVSDPGPNVGDDSLNASAVLVRGPYLQAATPTSLVVSWATDLAAGSAVEVTGPAVARVYKGRTFPGVDEQSQHPLEGFQHEVVVSGLAAGQAYTYTVQSLATATMPASFVTAPPQGEGFEFAVFGDTRTEGARHQQVATAMATRAPEFVLFTGDAVTVGNDVVEWNDWFAAEAPTLRHAVLYGTFGNHEALLGLAAFDTMFRAPPGGFSERTYSFDHGSLHMAVIDAYDGNRSGVMAWLDQDLGAAKARGQKLLTIAMHPPVYTFSQHAPDTTLRADLAPLLAKHGVRAVFTGHNHVYERFQVDGVLHLTVGGGGAPMYNATEQSPLPDPASLRCKAVEGLSYLVGSVAGDTMTLKVYDPSGAMVDQVSVDAAQPLGACP